MEGKELLKKFKFGAFFDKEGRERGLVIEINIEKNEIFFTIVNGFSGSMEHFTMKDFGRIKLHNGETFDAALFHQLIDHVKNFPASSLSPPVLQPKQLRRFHMQECPPEFGELQKISLGTSLLIKGSIFTDGDSRLGVLCWLGQDSKTRTWLAVLQLPDFGSHSFECVDSSMKSSGEWVNQRLWHIPDDRFRVLLVPLECLDLEEVPLQKHRYPGASLKSVSDSSLALHDNHLGCHVTVAPVVDLLAGQNIEGRLCWTGTVDGGEYAVVKLKKHFRNQFNFIDGIPQIDIDALANFTCFTDCVGDTVLLPAAMITTTDQHCSQFIDGNLLNSIQTKISDDSLILPPRRHFIDKSILTKQTATTRAVAPPVSSIPQRQQQQQDDPTKLDLILSQIDATKRPDLAKVRLGDKVLVVSQEINQKEAILRWTGQRNGQFFAQVEFSEEQISIPRYSPVPPDRNVHFWHAIDPVEQACCYFFPLDCITAATEGMETSNEENSDDQPKIGLNFKGQSKAQCLNSLGCPVNVNLNGVQRIGRVVWIGFFNFQHFAVVLLNESVQQSEPLLSVADVINTNGYKRIDSRPAEKENFVVVPLNDVMPVEDVCITLLQISHEKEQDSIGQREAKTESIEQKNVAEDGNDENNSENVPPAFEEEDPPNPPPSTCSSIAVKQGRSNSPELHHRHVSFNEKSPADLRYRLREFDLELNQSVHMMEDFNGDSRSHAEGILKWMGEINYELLFAIESKRVQRQQHEYVRDYVEFKGCEVGKHVWLIHPDHVRPNYQPFVQPCDLPKDDKIKPVAFQLYTRMKVIGSGELGIAKWTGKINGEWFVGLDVENKVTVHCDILQRYPILIDLFHCERGRPMMITNPQNVTVAIGAEARLAIYPRNNYSNPPENPRPCPSEVKTYSRIPHSLEYFNKVQEYKICPKNCPFVVGQAVEVNIVANGVKSCRAGVVKWIGFHQEEQLVGVELEKKTWEGGTDGQFPQIEGGRRLFTCAPLCGIVVPWDIVNANTQEIQTKRTQREKEAKFFEQAKNENGEWITKAFPPFHIDDKKLRTGAGTGIQGRMNSCYIDSSLFAMFAFNDTFDGLLVDQPTQTKDVAELRRLLREGIVNPLRKFGVVNYPNVMKLRKLFETISRTKGMTTDQKDAEEFMSTLFHKVLDVPMFIQFDDGDSCHIFQLMIEADQNHIAVRRLLDLTLRFSKTKLSHAPTNLILLLPREGSDYSAFKMIMFDLELDITELIVDEKKCSCQKYRPEYRVCRFCQENPNGDEDWDNVHRDVMDLYAVLCIQTSHFVTFVRNPQTKQWFFFDSMADRKNDMNIPCVQEVPGLEQWITESYNKTIKGQHRLPKNMDELQKRLVTTSYVLLYRHQQRQYYN